MYPAVSSTVTSADDGPASSEYGGTKERQPAAVRSGGSAAEGPSAAVPSSSSADTSAKPSAHGVSVRGPLAAGVVAASVIDAGSSSAGSSAQQAAHRRSSQQQGPLHVAVLRGAVQLGAQVAAGDPVVQVAGHLQYPQPLAEQVDGQAHLYPPAGGQGQRRAESLAGQTSHSRQWLRRGPAGRLLDPVTGQPDDEAPATAGLLLRR